MLIDVSIRIICLAVLLLLPMRLARVKSAAAWHAAYTVLLVAMLLMPLLRASLPVLPLPVLPALAPIAAPEPVPLTEFVIEAEPIPMRSKPSAPRAVPQAKLQLPTWEQAAFLLYLIVALAMLGRLALGYRDIRALLLTSLPLEDPRVPPGVRVSDRVSVPVTVGCIAPKVILPAGWQGWDDAKLEAALTHELAHARRSDPLCATAAALNRCLFWFHPLAWWIERRLDRLAEEAADDACVRALADRSRYARVLLEMAAAVSVRQGRFAWTAVPMARPATISQRIDRVLDGRAGAGRAMTRAAGTAMLVTAMPILLAAATFQAVPGEPTAAPALFSGQLTIIEGTVLESSNYQPIEGAQVILMPTDRGQVRFSGSIWQTELSPADPDPASEKLAVLTGSDGKFRFRIDAPAKFRLFVAHDDYVNTSSGSDAPAFEAEPGIPKDDIAIQLKPQGSISGQVIDVETEEPIPGLVVMPLVVRTWPTARGLWPARTQVTTDQEGRYEIDGLAPGEYYLRLTPPMGADFDDPTPLEDFREAAYVSYIPSWYPGVDAMEQAVPLMLGSRGRLEGIDFGIAKRRTAAIRGHVFGDESTGDVSISLTEIERTTSLGAHRGVASSERPVGSGFEIRNLYPGYYWLFAETADEEVTEKLYASLTFQVGDDNLDGMDLHLRMGLTVKGRVRIADREEISDQPTLPKEGTRVQLFAVSRGSVKNDRSVVVRAEDGSFVFEGVVPGELLVLVGRVPQGYEVSEIRYNNSVTVDHVIAVEPNVREHRLDITLAPASGSVLVTVTDGLDPAPGAIVLVAPNTVDQSVREAALNRVFISRGTADDDGRATIGPLLPGTYLVMAYPQGALWKNDRNRVFTAGQEVRVGDGPALIQVRTQPAVR